MCKGQAKGAKLSPHASKLRIYFQELQYVCASQQSPSAMAWWSAPWPVGHHYVTSCHDQHFWGEVKQARMGTAKRKCVCDAAPLVPHRRHIHDPECKERIVRVNQACPSILSDLDVNSASFSGAAFSFVTILYIVNKKSLVPSLTSYSISPQTKQEFTILLWKQEEGSEAFLFLSCKQMARKWRSREICWLTPQGVGLIKFKLRIFDKTL